MILLPAIDIIGGKTVRLTEGDYDQVKGYDLTPLEAALSFESAGAQWIHMVDLEGARSGHPVNQATLREIRKESKARLEVGGGIRSLDSALELIDLGIDRVVIGSRAIEDPAEAARIIGRLGAKAAIGMDLRDGRPAIHGWTQVSDIDGLEFAKMLEAEGAQCFIVTDIATDGRLTGPNLPLMESFASHLTAEVIASGGVSQLQDLADLAITGASGVIVGKAIYEGRFTVSEAIALLNQESLVPKGCLVESSNVQTP